ncbi:MAG TPA: glycoside hydrolase family 3 N-terminal domain-containing protein [Steroidobacteraceae bacterium]|nr:glycoside hydrolase family 3 N-terminal domain-containing protein [Steroidobacteraceae bacterium]
MPKNKTHGRGAWRCGALATLGALLSSGSGAWAAGTAVHPTLWPQRAATPAHPDTDAFVDALLGRMSLEEKVGQMIQADIASLKPGDLRTYKLGAVLAGGGSAPDGNVRTTPQAWLDLVDALYRAELEGDSSAHAPIPLLFGIDAVHGNAKIIGATIFPHNVGLGATHDVALIERIGEATAQEVAAVGIDWTFAPTVAVARDVRWGRSYESYSDDPQLVAAYAAAMVRGLQGERSRGAFMSPGHTLSSVKHFLGDGGTFDGRDQGDNRSSEATLIRVHAAGYPPAIDAGAQIVMASFSGWQGVKMHANHDLLTTILKERLGFEGFIVGDWNAHEEIPGCSKFSCPQAIRAGLDMFMAPDSWRRIYDNTLAQARAGEIPAERIDDAVRRILRVKALAGLFTRGAPRERADAGNFTVLGSAKHREIARCAVRESLVLLKNERGTLPLSPRAHLLVTGEAADRIDRQTGGWTIDWQGDHNRNADFPGGTSVYAALRAVVTAAGGSVTLSRDGSFSTRPDAAVVVFGETPYAEFEGDRETLAFAPRDLSSMALLKSLRARGVPTISVFLSGRPLWVNPEINASDAFVAAWLPGTEAEGIADVLLAGGDGHLRYDFAGRLSFPWPATGMPVRYDGGDRVSGALFARGYGLSYAHGGNVGSLSEDPQLAADRGGADTLFQSGHVTAPWSAFVADELATVRLTGASQASPRGALTVALAGADLNVHWSGSGPGVFWIGGRPIDLRAAAGAGDVIEARVRVEAIAAERVVAGLRCASGSQAAESGCGGHGAGTLDVTQLLRSIAPGTTATLSLPLACFRRAGEALASVAGPFEMRATGSLSLTLTDIRFVPAHDRRCDPGVAMPK